MTTIPASQLVQITPSVLPAGGNPLALNGIQLTTSTRPPIGTVQSFSTAASVGAYFGLNSPEYLEALVYFNGFNGKTSSPGAMLCAQYPINAVSAYLRGGNASSLLTTLQGVNSGNLELVVDGFSWKSTAINLTSATSLTGVATLIQSDLTLPGSASFTGSIAPINPIGGGSSLGTLTVTAVGSGTIAVGQVIAGSGVTAGTYITAYGSGTGGNGTYAVNFPQTVASEALTGAASAAAFTASIANSGVMTVTAVGSGTLQPGMLVAGTGVAAGTGIISQLTGPAGGTGTYQLSVGQSVSSESMTGAPANITVAYDSISGGFVINSSLTGMASTISYAARQLASVILLTQATGAVLSQGAAPATPSVFMAGITNITQNWASFWTNFDPDYELGMSGNAQKLAFAQWTNSVAPRYVYASWDPDQTAATVSAPNNTTCLGYLLQSQNLSGTNLNWNSSATITAAFTGSVAGFTLTVSAVSAGTIFPGMVVTGNTVLSGTTIIIQLTGTPGGAGTYQIDTSQTVSSEALVGTNEQDNYLAAFICGTIASINFAQTNGRITFAYKGQTGLVANVIDPIASINLAGNPQVPGSYGNGYNFYGAYGTPNQNFIQYQRGTISGPYQWLDTYVNQIQLNASLQLALMLFLSNTTSVPYNSAGYAAIETALADPINAALNFGTIRAGVTLSSTQITEVNTAAGLPIDNVLSTIGWYLQVLDASPTVRQGRTSPPMTLWYMDGESIQSINLASIVLQ